jgi:thiol-disulfide isomerase/thioredoxin
LRTDSYTFWIGGNLGDPRNAPTRTALGATLDGWRLAGLNGDPPVAFEDLTRPTLLNFWASWCPPCRVEFPHLARVALAPDAHAFDVLFVNMSDQEEAALAFLRGQPPELHTVLDELDRLSRRSSVLSIPTTLLLDADGVVLAGHVGIMTPTITDFFDAVAANPGVGTFVAADVADIKPQAELLPVDADTAAPIAFGEPVLGTLTNRDFQHAYRFEGQAGDTVSVSLREDSSELDAYLVLMTAEGERLAENDDVAAGTDAAVEVTLPADGTYIIVATRFLEAEGFSSGDYTLTVTSSQSGADGAILAYGSVTQGRVSGIDPRRFYGFEGRAGDVVTLRLEHEPGAVPLQVEIKDPGLDRLAVSDESAGGEAALTVELPADGEYRIVVFRQRTRDRDNETYTLALDLAGEPATPSDGALEAGALAYGATVSGALGDDNVEDRWVFEGRAGDVIALVMARAVDSVGGLDGYMVLLGPDGATLAEVDDTPDDVMPRLEGFALPADGTYTVVATRFGFANGFSSGEYSLTLARSGGTDGQPAPDDSAGPRWIDPDNLPPDLRRIAYNSRALGAIDAGNVDDWYLFQGREGDAIRLQMTADTGDLDPFLILVDGEGIEIARNDDAPGGTTAARIDMTLPTTGVYLIRATRYGFQNGPSSGEYTLALETEAAPLDPDELSAAVALPYGAPVAGTLSMGDVGRQYTFEGGAGDAITIAVRRASGDLDPALSLRGPDGREIAFSRDWTSDAEARIARLVLPDDGTYTLDVILEDLNTSGDFDLLLLAQAPPSPPEGAFVGAPGLDVEIVLVWAGEADLDLAVAPPDPDQPGEVTDRANDLCAEGAPAPQERIVWAEGDAPGGLYAITVRYAFDCAGTGEAVPFMLAVVRAGAVVEVTGGTLARPGDSYGTLLDADNEF